MSNEKSVIGKKSIKINKIPDTIYYIQVIHRYDISSEEIGKTVHFQGYFQNNLDSYCTAVIVYQTSNESYSINIPPNTTFSKVELTTPAIPSGTTYFEVKVVYSSLRSNSSVFIDNWNVTLNDD